MATTPTSSEGAAATAVHGSVWPLQQPPPQLPPKAEWGEGGGRVAPPAFAEAFLLVFGCHSPWGRLHPTREL